MTEKLHDAFSHESLALSPRQLVQALVMVAKAGHASYVHGAPGVGKTALIMNDVANALDLQAWDFRTNSKEAVDLRGVPYVLETDEMDRFGHPKKITKWAVPEDLPTGPALLFLDEFNTCAKSMEAPLYQVVQERRLGAWVAHPRTRIIAAGNREKDRAIANKLSTALMSRFVHFEFRVDVDQWLLWASKNNIHPAMTAYVKMMGTAVLHNFDPLTPNMRTHPNPRTIEMAANIYAQNPPREMLLQMLTGAVGPGLAAEWLAFINLYEKLPRLEDVLADPSGHPVPQGKDAMSVRYALAGALARKMDKKNIGAAVTFLDRMSEEFSVFAISDAIARDESLKETHEFIKWGSKAALRGLIG